MTIPNTKYNPPNILLPSMAQLVAAVAITRGLSIQIDPTTGNAIPMNGLSTPPLPSVGIAANNAQPGEIVFVQTSGVIIVPKGAHAIPDGDFCGSLDATGALQDLGAGLVATSGTVSFAIAGIVMFQDSASFTIMIQPQLVPSISAPGGAVTSVFGRIGAVVSVSGDYVVAQITGAAPLASPAFTGTPTAPSPLSTDDSTAIATTDWVRFMNATGSQFTGTLGVRNVTLQSGSGSTLTLDTPGIAFHDGTTLATAAGISQVATVNVSAATFKTIDATAANAVTLVPAPGAGKQIIVDEITINMQFGTTPYTTGTGALGWAYSTGAALSGVATLLLLTQVHQTQSQIGLGGPANSGNVFANQAVVLALASGPANTAGDSPFVVTVRYHVIPVA